MLKPMALPLGTRVGGIGTGADELKVSRPSRPDGATPLTHGAPRRTIRRTLKGSGESLGRPTRPG
ncbi:hypothetical protein Aglo01_12840 [Actinokineospora globicatena]|nr:hypothetical protein Aglo01_12840 [Actinokineospora globicatena]GLW83635.1 hypothetical protein Aglo02_12750 [Actinokineospora globicatena]